VRQKARQERTKPLIAELRKILDDAHRRLSPKSVMALAIAYGTKRWTALTQFLDNGSLEIDNSAHRLMPGASGDAQPLNGRCAVLPSGAKTLMTIVNVPRATKQTVPHGTALDGIAIGREQDARDFSTVAQTLVRGLVTP